MSDTLEERLDENREHAINFKEVYPEGLPAGLQGGIELALEDATPIARAWFPKEIARFRRLAQAIGPKIAGRYLLIKTDSSNVTLGFDVYETLIAKRMKDADYTDDQICEGMTCTDEVYKNSIIFANNASTLQCDYEKRGKPFPEPEELKENQRKPIYIEFLITGHYTMTRVTDSGPGFDPSEKIATACAPDNIMELSEEEQMKYLQPSGTGLFFIKEYTGELPLVDKTNSCSVSFSLIK